MLNVTPFSKGCVTLNVYADFIPGISSATNLVDLFLKHVYQPWVGKESLKSSHYFAYLDTKSLENSLILLVPVIGNILYSIKTLYRSKKAKELESQVKELLKQNSPKSKNNALNTYGLAFKWGSLEGAYQLGYSWRYFPPEYQENGYVDSKTKAEEYFLYAAALGHEKALEELYSLEDND